MILHCSKLDSNMAGHSSEETIQPSAYSVPLRFKGLPRCHDLRKIRDAGKFLDQRLQQTKAVCAQILVVHDPVPRSGTTDNSPVRFRGALAR